MNNTEVCTLDNGYTTVCSLLKSNVVIDSKYIKRTDTEKLSKIGLIANPGDTFTICLDSNMRLYVTDQNNRKITVLRNSKLLYILLRLLNKYDTNIMQLQAI